jgi:glycosyltransferase involved in cell wall biosynthesis
VRTAIVIPARNEQATVGHVVAGARLRMPGAHIIVVDDASTDHTAERADAAGADVLALRAHSGYAGALREGYRAALDGGATALLQLDADGQHLPADLPRLLDSLGDADLVLGSRFLGPTPGYAIPPLRRVGMAACRWMASAVGGLRVTDPTSGLRALTPRVAGHIADHGFPSGLTETSLLIHLHRAGIRIREIPVSMRASQGDSMHAGLAGGAHLVRISWAVLGLAARGTARDIAPEPALAPRNTL